MIEGYNMNVILTSGNSLMLLCAAMIGYGVWKISKIIYMSMKNEVYPSELSKVLIVEAAKEKQKTIVAAESKNTEKKTESLSSNTSTTKLGGPSTSV